MTAMNIVRFRVKPGRAADFIAHHEKVARDTFEGFRHFSLVRTGPDAFCVVGEWESLDKLAAGRPAMIRTLDGMRDMLEDLGPGLGVTDPVLGEVVVEMEGPAAGKAAESASAARKAPESAPAARKAAESAGGAR